MLLDASLLLWTAFRTCGNLNVLQLVQTIVLMRSIVRIQTPVTHANLATSQVRKHDRNTTLKSVETNSPGATDTLPLPHILIIRLTMHTLLYALDVPQDRVVGAPFGTQFPPLARQCQSDTFVAGIVHEGPCRDLLSPGQ